MRALASMDASLRRTRHKFLRSAAKLFRLYILDIVKLPVPEQPEPFSDQVPEIVFPFALPCSVRVLPAGVPESTVNPKEPVTFPLKFPLKLNEPDSLAAVVKQGEADVNLKLLMLRLPSPLTISDVPNVNIVALVESVSVAFQLPLMLVGFELDPQPTRVSPAISKIAAAKYFMYDPSVFRVRRGA